MPLVPEYAHAGLDQPKPMLRWTIGLGTLPLITGTSILTAYGLPHASILPILGLATILIGLFCVAFGAVCLSIHFKEQRRREKAVTRALLLGCIASPLLLIANFHAAYVCAVLGVRLMLI
jgi:uncharacterized membrane protein YbhN (UPF0104 family)